MHYPEFFDAAPVLMMRDPLAGFLGAMQDGLVDYHYADAVMLAGHSCPTVAAAFLMTRAALNSLYPDEIPLRGGIKVSFRDDQRAGVTGVIANVVSFITGVTQENGFKGIGGHFDRRHLLEFNVDMDAEIRFTRVDTNAAAEVAADLSTVPMDPHVRQLLPECISGSAKASAVEEFRRLWQDRVRRLLLEHKDDKEVIQVRLLQ
ncbi:MAG: hypothetical protein ACRETA_00760 [Gammaproteobacteria bacterium]